MHIAERRANTVQNALEEAKTMLEQADRARKLSEQVLHLKVFTVKKDHEFSMSNLYRRKCL